MKKLLIFDLDGVLVDLRDMHYKTLNRALIEANLAPITKDAHKITYNGLSTRQKLHKMGLDSNTAYLVNAEKQFFTIEAVKELKFNKRLTSLMRKLSENNTIAVASNSVRDTVKFALLRLGIMEYISFYFSNQDVINPKPSPEIFYKCMIKANIGAPDTTIVEDNGYGIEAAKKTMAKLIVVKNPQDLYEIF